MGSKNWLFDRAVGLLPALLGAGAVVYFDTTAYQLIEYALAHIVFVPPAGLFMMLLALSLKKGWESKPAENSNPIAHRMMALIGSAALGIFTGMFAFALSLYFIAHIAGGAFLMIEGAFFPGEAEGPSGQNFQDSLNALLQRLNEDVIQPNLPFIAPFLLVDVGRSVIRGDFIMGFQVVRGPFVIVLALFPFLILEAAGTPNLVSALVMFAIFSVLNHLLVELPHDKYIAGQKYGEKLRQARAAQADVVTADQPIPRQNTESNSRAERRG